MFKKPVKVSAQNQLSGKDRKVIKTKLSEALDNECVQKLFVLEQKIICCKIQGAKMLIYNGEDYPLFVDGTGKNNFFPSLYVAMAFQPLISCLTINEGVEAYIYNGANLMWPGVKNYEGLGDFVKDQTVGIRNSKGEIIAIGAMGCSKKQLTDFSGVAVYILHYLGDKLWEMGSKTIPQVVIPLKVVQVKKQQPKPEPKPEVNQEVKKQQNAKEKKPQAKKEEPKGNNQQSVKEPEQKAKEKTPEQSDQQSESEDDFMNLVHTKNQPKGRVIKMEPKQSAKVAFVEDEREEKNKKKQPAKEQKGRQKGGKNKKEESDEDAMQEEEVPQPKKDKQKGGKNKKEESDQDEMEEEEEPQSKKNQKDNKKTDNKKGGKKETKKQKGKKKEESDEQEVEDSKKQGMKEEKSDEQDKEEKGEQKSALNSKLMDEYFKESFLNAIKLTKIEQELPIDSGRFFMDFMLLARPEGVKLEIKQSSYKKIGKFFEEMGKKKIIEYKHPKDRKAQGAQITKIFWENEDLKNHVPTIKKMGSKEEEEKVETYSKAKLKLSKTVNLETVYKPSQDLFNQVLKKPLNLMPAEGEKEVTDKQEIEFVTEKELREKIERYINKIVGTKEEKDKELKKVEKTLLIDYNKHEYLKELLKKEIDEYEENKQKDEILKADEASDDQDGEKKKKKAKKSGVGKEMLKIDRHYLVEKLMKKASPYYHVYDEQNGIDIFKDGTFKGIQIVAEKANNKNVTRVLGLELFIVPKTEADDQIHGFAHTLQTKFACSVNVQNLPGKNAGKEIVVHGAFLDELEEIFTQEYDLPSKFITTQNKLDKKKKN